MHSKTETPIKPGFFERLGKYNRDAFNYLKSNINKTKPVDVAHDDSQNANVVMPSNDSPKQENSTKEPENDKTSDSSNDFDPLNYWIVHIPIIPPDNNDDIKGEYEKTEAKLNQMLLEQKVGKSIGKTNVGTMYEIGNRYVTICETVMPLKENDLLTFDGLHTELEGSIMQKYNKLQEHMG
jgi:hypothetical protein